MSEKRSWEAAREILHKVRAEDGAGSMFILANEIDAAEERGRRRGVEETADKAYTAAHEAAEEIWKLHGAVQEAPCYQAAVAALRTIRKIESALAPRDSGPLAAPKMQPAPAEQRAAELRRASPRARVDEPEAPPDSGYSGGCDRNGEGRDGCGRPTCSKCYPVKPDSGEREVPSVQADIAEMRRFWASAVAADSETAKEVMLVLDELERHREGVCLDPSLAQRILAAMERWARMTGDKECIALAAELRARLPR